MENIPDTICINQDNYQTKFDNWNKDNNDNLHKWLKKGLVVEVGKGIFASSVSLERQKQELENLYNLIDVNTIFLNNLENEIKVNCRYKANETRKILTDRFKNFENQDIKFALTHICVAIIELPLYLLEAFEKYPDTLNEPQQIYFRNKYLVKKLKSAEDKFDINMVLFEDEFEFQTNKVALNSIFLFIEWFINKLNYNNTASFDYIKSKPFMKLFIGLMKYKGYYEEAFEHFNFANIIEAEKQITIFKADQDNGEKYLYFDCPFNIETIEEVHRVMTDKGVIKADLKDFYKIFNHVKGEIEKPITWLILSERGTRAGRGNQTALYVFLTMMLDNDITNDHLRKARSLFVDQRGYFIENVMVKRQTQTKVYRFIKILRTILKKK